MIDLADFDGDGEVNLKDFKTLMHQTHLFRTSGLSIDDFYLPSDEMKFAIEDNPWNVSRGFPGSHSVELMNEKLIGWKIDGE